MSRMGPDQGQKLYPRFDAGTTDFELAAQLYHAIFFHDGPIPVDVVRGLCCNALQSPAGCFVLGEALLGNAAWSDLYVEVQAKRTLVAATPAPEERLPDRLAFPLLFRDRMLGFVGVGGHPGGYDGDAIRRFADLGALLAAMLQARTSHDQRREELAISEREIRRQSQILDQIHDSVITMDLQGYITGWNAGAEHLFGYNADEIIGRNILLLYADEDASADGFFNAFMENGSREMKVRRRKKSGDIFWASVSLSVSHDDSGVPNGLIGYIVDISGEQEAEEKLRLHSRIFDCAGEAILVTDATERIVSVNSAFCAITGFSASEVIGITPSTIRLGTENGRWQEIQEVIAREGKWCGELSPMRKDGNTYPAWASISSVQTANGDVTHYCFVFADITERKEAEAQIYRLAYYDTLTNLPNRALLYSLLEQALIEAHRRHSHGAILFIDLNRFKHINDSFGHAPADSLLAEVGRRLAQTLRKEDVVSRLGGDEFVIALFDINRRDDAAVVTRKILSSLAEPFFIEGHEILLSASIGISVFPDDGRDAETLIRNADVAMYRAKQLGTGSFLYYSREMNLRSLERLKTEGGLRHALERNEFLLHFQPQLELNSGHIIGVEALLRWEQPGHGLISPAQFIPVAEETGLIVPIGEWVIEATCRQLREWLDAGLHPVKVAVNLSPRQFSHNLPRVVMSYLRQYDIPPDLLELEITESMLMHSADSVVAMMQEFADAGIVMSLDDFGTGYSSLSYLKRFPIDTLKIDQSFVRGIPHDADDSAIATAIIGMAKALRLRVIAEGVENESQLDFLKTAGCDEIQGYWFSKPVGATEYAALLSATNLR
ncbi:MAG: EAL domain-containing protein [Rhodocyclaceae bacterium]|nr:EAL domain-containing protein [Rhodocyclaceae bacterium]